MNKFTVEAHVQIFDINLLNQKIVRETNAYDCDGDFWKEIHEDQLIEDCKSLINMISKYLKSIPSINERITDLRECIKSGEISSNDALTEVNTYTMHQNTVMGFYNHAVSILEKIPQLRKNRENVTQNIKVNIKKIN